ncbi:heat stress transcription factor A-2b-like [Iris pallida]|uniref:Heat stress transcription factor A-2b-like n=1 Tax=Iris pallida TaxID=29817 RepID=A0AAX6E1M2_IRIPA|nr:heat stress transcription factor A-2b-like [Iris pallida]KAJ6836508.1 heat stress transcription factor A-2b-like [Iris pallida]
MTCCNKQIREGFRKVDTDRWEFANEGFLRGQKHLLKTIKRRRPPSHAPPPHQSLPPYLEVGQFGLDGEIDRLRRDKNVLMAELVKLRQEQQNTRAHLKAMEERLQGTEQRQQQMMAFLARAMRNPDFLQQLVQQKDKRKELEEAISKKRRRPIDRGPDPCEAEPSGGQKFDATALLEPQQAYGYEVPELQVLALEMQGAVSDYGEGEEVREQQEEVDVELNDEFWQELLNENMGEEKGRPDLGGRSEEDVNVLTERLEYLSSSSPK